MFRIGTKSKLVLKIMIIIKITDTTFVKNTIEEAIICLPFIMGKGCSEHSQAMAHLILTERARNYHVPMHR